MRTSCQISSVDFSKGLHKEHEDYTDSLDAIEGKNGLTLSIHDGFFSSIFATLTSGVFLTGFALSLGGNEFHIGVLAAISVVANLFQFAGSYVVQRIGSRTPVSINACTASRSIWLLVVALPFASSWLQRDQILWTFLAIIALSHFCGAVSAVAWLSWISDLVPQKFRGRFFGKRNMMIGIATLAFSLLGGKFLDLWGKNPSGFQILFFMALIGGAVSILYLKRIPEPPLVRNTNQKPYHEMLVHPLRDASFRRLLIFTIVWSFGVNFSAPFFVVYKLKELHLSYTVITLLVAVTVSFDLIGMRFWGRITDEVGNRPVMLICSVLAAFLPFGWLFTSGGGFLIFFLLPLLHTAGGFFWAGMNLASTNMLFRLAPKNCDTVYFAVYATVNGLSAALAAVMGGIIAHIASEFQLNLFFTHLIGLKIIYLLSWALRFMAIPLLLQIEEPKGLPFIKAIKVITTLRSTNLIQSTTQ